MSIHKEMYLKLFCATEQAANILISAQRECEELYVSSPEPELKIISPAIKRKGARIRGKILIRALKTSQSK